MSRRLVEEIAIGPFVVALFDADQVDESGSLGEWDHEARTITLSASLAGADRWVVLLHELMHAISDLYDLDVDAEHVCTTLANGLVQSLGAHLRHPPTAPVPMDDDKTPTIQIEPRRVAPPHKE